ncbi:MAG: formate dehydrogenase accessory protein FdhE, partial [Candidatus Rokuibacteriota bacterium]
AASAPVLEALGPAAGGACPGPPAEGGCPRCGGLPQLSYLTEAGEALVTGPRMLLCCRCGDSWVHARMTCAGCGEQTTNKLPIFADAERFPHLRADACETCRRYLITIDLRKDPDAVPVVDELAALPLDLYVKERGFTKIVPNLMAIG